MSTALSIDRLSFHFDQETTPLFFDNISLSFASNTLHFIRGKNGSGKSTLFRLIRGIIYSDEHISGAAIIDGKKYRLSDDESCHKRLGNKIRMVAQKFDDMLAGQFTFTQNLELATMPHYPLLQKFTGETKIPELIERFGINFDVPVGMLSGGQRQILAILMALQKRTSILLLDEPTAALDDKNSGMVMSFLQDLLNIYPDLTVLIICHDKELVEEYAKKQYYQIEVEDSGTRSVSLIQCK